MTEMVPCTSCTGGQYSYPVPALDASGNPTIIMEVHTCISCHGSGTVEVPE